MWCLACLCETVRHSQREWEFLLDIGMSQWRCFSYTFFSSILYFLFSLFHFNRSMACDTESIKDSCYSKCMTTETLMKMYMRCALNGYGLLSQCSISGACVRRVCAEKSIIGCQWRHFRNGSNCPRLRTTTHHSGIGNTPITQL